MMIIINIINKNIIIYSGYTFIQPTWKWCFFLSCLFALSIYSSNLLAYLYFCLNRSGRSSNSMHVHNFFFQWMNEYYYVHGLYSDGKNYFYVLYVVRSFIHFISFILFAYYGHINNRFGTLFFPIFHFIYLSIL